MRSTNKTQTPARKPRILWASVYCLLDTSSGASMAIREMLRQLANNGYEIHIAGCTIFDHINGIARLKAQWPQVAKSTGEVIRIVDAPLAHQLFVTRKSGRPEMTSVEERTWFNLYLGMLDNTKPDLLFYYGGHPIDNLMAHEARCRNIPVAFYLANSNYSGSRWCRDVDVILTDSNATAEMYKSKFKYRVTPIGAFIDPSRVIATERAPQRILMVNPSIEKGAGLVVQLALMMMERKPEVMFEVVESRGNWQELVKQITTAIGKPMETLPNVIITPNTDDMRPIYGRAKVVLAPSLLWESAGRVLVEALLNGIPALITNQGGMPEMIQGAGIIVNLPPQFHEAPYSKLPPFDMLNPVCDILCRIFDDEESYRALSQKAYSVGHEQHGLETNTARLIEAIKPLLKKHAGDKDFKPLLKKMHKQNLV